MCASSVFMLKTEGPASGHPESDADSRDATVVKDEEQWYVCRNCRQRLTRPDARMSIEGRHRHTFANPSGVVYEIACFSVVVGFGFMGPPSTDFTWFAGHTWRIVICAGCATHIGWFFTRQGSGQFWGLIADRLKMVSLPED
ncbi:MAG: hypothetical protein KFF50_15775 [Desulfatitalea sp.]|nr:hypothetical protein [Desulfatitalea sp.]